MGFFNGYLYIKQSVLFLICFCKAIKVSVFALDLTPSPSPTLLARIAFGRPPVGAAGQGLGIAGAGRIDGVEKILDGVKCNARRSVGLHLPGSFF
jgi:hypothetical protein